LEEILTEDLTPPSLITIMRIIKVNAIDSTNSFVRKFYDNNGNFEPVCVSAAHQTNGRGQRGANWHVEPGQNLTFSILYPHSNLDLSQFFHLNMAISLAIITILGSKQVPDLRVKWPNDIMSQKYKIGGILIENIVNTEGIVASIIGVGINVNQTNFEKLPQAGSLKNMTGNQWNVDELLHDLTAALESSLSSLAAITQKTLLDRYESHMFRKDVVSTFEVENNRFSGIIRGVTTDGKLQVEQEEQQIHTYSLKEIKLLY